MLEVSNLLTIDRRKIGNFYQKNLTSYKNNALIIFFHIRFTRVAELHNVDAVLTNILVS